MKRLIFGIVIMLAMFLVISDASATGWPIAQTSQNMFKVSYNCKVDANGTDLGKGALVLLDYTNAATTEALMVVGTTATSSVHLVGVLEDTIEAGHTGHVVIFGYVDALFDSGGATAGANFGTGTTSGEATDANTGGGTIIASRSGRGLTKVFVNPK